MRRLNAWLLRRPLAYGLVFGAAFYAAWVGLSVLGGEWHGWLRPLPFPAVLAILVAVLACRKGRQESDLFS